MKKLLSYLGGVLGVFILWVYQASAHVRFIADDQKMEQLGGPDIETLLSPFQNSTYLVLMIGTALGVFVLYALVHAHPLIRRLADRMQEKAKEYDHMVPWMLRLSAGILLIGAGTSGWFMSPVLHGDVYAMFMFVQVLVGFFLLAGFLTSLASIALVLFYGIAFSYDPYLIGSLDVLALALALIIRKSTTPGIDDMIGIPDFSMKKLYSYVPTILRVGIGTSFVYLAVYEKFLNPNLTAWVADITHLTSAIPVSAEMWVVASGIIELIVGVFLLIGFKTRLSAIIAFAVLSVSFFYFEEDVASHVTLFGVLTVLISLGGGLFSVDRLLRRSSRK